MKLVRNILKVGGIGAAVYATVWAATSPNEVRAAIDALQGDSTTTTIQASPQTSIHTGPPLVGPTVAGPAMPSTTPPDILDIYHVRVTVSPDGTKCEMANADGSDLFSVVEGARIMASSNVPNAAIALVTGANTIRDDGDLKLLNQNEVPVDIGSNNLTGALQCATPHGVLGAYDDVFEDDANLDTVPVVTSENQVSERLDVSKFSGSNLSGNIESAGSTFPLPR